MKKILVILLFVIFSSNVYSASRTEKDLKKVSKLTGFVDSEGKIYPIEKISNIENIILIWYIKLTWSKNSYCILRCDALLETYFVLISLFSIQF